MTARIFMKITGYNLVVCSYHQKYLLQKQGWLMAELELEKTEDLVHSMVAARLNGYTNGYGSKVDSFYPVIYQCVVVMIQI